jgi:hypothetical protein
MIEKARSVVPVVYSIYGIWYMVYGIWYVVYGSGPVTIQDTGVFACEKPGKILLLDASRIASRS